MAMVTRQESDLGDCRSVYNDRSGPADNHGAAKELENGRGNGRIILVTE